MSLIPKRSSWMCASLDRKSLLAWQVSYHGHNNTHLCSPYHKSNSLLWMSQGDISSDDPSTASYNPQAKFLHIAHHLPWWVKTLHCIDSHSEVYIWCILYTGIFAKGSSLGCIILPKICFNFYWSYNQKLFLCLFFYFTFFIKYFLFFWNFWRMVFVDLPPPQTKNRVTFFFVPFYNYAVKKNVLNINILLLLCIHIYFIVWKKERKRTKKNEKEP